MMRKAIGLYFLLAGVTWVAGTPGEGILGRLAVADAVMAAFIIPLYVFRTRFRLRVPIYAWAFLPYLLSALLSAAFSWKALPSLLECVILGFLLLCSVLVYTHACGTDHKHTVRTADAWIVASAVLALIAIIDFLLVALGLPSPIRAIGQIDFGENGLVGTFRNTGQAGSYFGTALLLGLALESPHDQAARRRRLVSIIILALAVLLTVKRAAWLAVLLGICGLSVAEPLGKRSLRKLLVVVVLGLVASLTLDRALSMDESFQNRYTRKIASQDAAPGVAEWFTENVEAAIRAFLDHPFIGVGPAGVSGKYADLEIHSTYFAVLATTGLFGLVTYAGFIVVAVKAVRGRRAESYPQKLQGKRLAVVFLSLLVSYGYTNHLRKREFWIFIALSSAVAASARYRPVATLSSPESSHGGLV